MPGTPVRIGPFTDGLNNISLSGEAKDSELTELVNFEVGPDSSLWSRPPFETVSGSLIPNPAITNQYNVLGVYRNSNTEWYLIVATPTSGGGADIFAYVSADFTTTPTLIKSVPAGSQVTAYVQMNNSAYFCVSPSSAISGFKWSLGGATTDVTQMKKGNCMVAYKARLWIAGIDTATQSSRLYFSTIDATGIQPDLWSNTDFTDVAPGEGGFITALLPLNSSLLIFKNDGTWRISYASSPKNAQIDKVSGSIGASGPTSVVEFENYVYVYDQGRVYELVNNNYTQLNRFVKFNQDPNSVDGVTIGVDLSVLSRRLILRYFNTIYAYSIDSRSWSQWNSYLGTPGKLVELPGDSDSTTPSTYVAASKGISQNPSANLAPAFTDSTVPYINSLLGTGFTGTRSGTSLVVNSTVNSTATLYMNNADGSSGFNLKVATGQKYSVTLSHTKTSGTIIMRMNYRMRDGSITTQDSPTLTGSPVTYTFSVPDNAVLGYFTFRWTVTVPATLTISSLDFKRTNGAAPITLIKISDQYKVSSNTVEYIDCHMKTKSYDYQTASNMKRLFWWGADLKSNRYIEGKVVPVAVKRPPTWGALEVYTHAQLEAGTFGNPLSFLVTNLTITDGGDPANAQTENGRIFIKLKKSLRFKQLAFEMNMSTLGTAATGPCKIHSITSFVATKEKVVERFT